MAKSPSHRARILVVEDEAYVRKSLGELLEARGFDVHLTPGVPEATRHLERAPVDLVLTDLKLPGEDGLEMVKRVTSSFGDVPIIVLTGQGTIASAVECVKAGADDYLLKPADPDALEVAIERALGKSALQREVGYLRTVGTEPIDGSFPIGESQAWAKVIGLVRSVAPTDATVLLRGESGTGKELLARLVHHLSPRARRPYVRVNCAAVPLEMWESEFFGHRKGSFTGASADREGRFRLAHEGTLFMDEIGSMPLTGQAKILRVLQDGEFDRLGDEQPTRVDVRIVAATNSDLEAAVEAGEFRQDLLYRLDVIRIELPPLRDRPEDIPLLAAFFVRELAARLGRRPPEIPSEVISDLQAYSWPGNVRELRNVIERALILEPGDSLASLDLPLMVGTTAAGKSGKPVPGLNLRSELAAREREVLVEALRRSKGVRKKAAEILGVDQRNLGYYLHKHRIDPDKLPDG